MSDHMMSISKWQIFNLSSPETVQENKLELLGLLRKHSYKEGTFTLSAGKTSNFFIDCKKTILSSRGNVLSGEVIWDLVGRLDLHGNIPCSRQEIKGVAAVPLGGCSLATSVSIIAGGWTPLDIIYIRPEKKDHGTKNLIEYGTNLTPGSKVILVEDVITTGQSSLNACEILVKARFEVVVVIALVDRLEGGNELLKKNGYKLCSIYTKADFIPNSDLPTLT